MIGGKFTLVDDDVIHGWKHFCSTDQNLWPFIFYQSNNGVLLRAVMSRFGRLLHYYDDTRRKSDYQENPSRGVYSYRKVPPLPRAVDDVSGRTKFLANQGSSSFFCQCETGCHFNYSCLPLPLSTCATQPFTDEESMIWEQAPVYSCHH